jgi:hypothetical protein
MDHGIIIYPLWVNMRLRLSWARESGKYQPRGGEPVSKAQPRTTFLRASFSTEVATRPWMGSWVPVPLALRAQQIIFFSTPLHSSLLLSTPTSFFAHSTLTLFPIKYAAQSIISSTKSMPPTQCMSFKLHVFRPSGCYLRPHPSYPE